MLQAFLTEESGEEPRLLPTTLSTERGAGRLGAAPASDGSLYVFFDGDMPFKGPDGVIRPGMPITIGAGEDIGVTIGMTKYRLVVTNAQ